MRRLVSRLAILGFLSLAPSCSRPTEIVIKLEATGGAPPPTILVKLHRSTPFPAEVPAGPPYVTTALDGADLDLYVTPQGAETSLSLLWAKGSPRDLRVTVTVPGGGYLVMPKDPVDVSFIDGMGQTLPFTISAPPPDMGTVKDAAPQPDGGARDMATPADGAPRDMAAPKG